MQEKTIDLELVSSFTLKGAVPIIEKGKITVPYSELRYPNWGERIAYDCYMDENLFPNFDELDNWNTPEIVFEVYALNSKGVRNGKAQCIVCNKDAFHLLWECNYKNGEINGRFVRYDYETRIIRKQRKSFYVNGQAVEAKNVAEWRKKQAEINALAKSANVRKK